MSLQLRPYQKEAIGQVYEAIRQGDRRILLVALMGTGKTVVSSWIMRDAVSRGKRCVFLVPLTVLIDQTVATLEKLGVHCSALQGDRDYDRGADVTVASLQTVASRLRRGQSLEQILGHQDLLVVDEAHVTAFDTCYGELQDWILGNGGHTIGMTATPWRLSKKEWLGQRFDRAIAPLQPPDAIKIGAVVPCRGFHIGGAIDLDRLTVANGDYTQSSIAEQATQMGALQLVISEWRRLAGDRPTLMIGATVDQATATMQAFESAGVSAALVVGDTPKPERERIFEAVRLGQVQVICSVGCLTAGFDLPKISCVAYVRATKSRALFQQSAGRGSRPCPGKRDFILLDFGGNLKRFGNPLGRQNYSICKPSANDRDISAADKTCPECGANVPRYASFCPECGAEFLTDGHRQGHLAVLPDGLNEYIDRPTRDAIALMRLNRRIDFKKRAASPDSAIENFHNTHGYTPQPEWLRNAVLGKHPSTQRKLAFVEWLRSAYRGQPRWRDKWLEHHLILEFGTSDLGAIFGNAWQTVLDLPINATIENAREAYRDRLLKLSPDDGEEIHALNQAMVDAHDAHHAGKDTVGAG